MRIQLDTLTVAIFIIAVIVGVNAFVNRSARTIEVYSAPPAAVPTPVPSVDGTTPPDDLASNPLQLPPAFSEDIAQAAIISPYDNYAVTQGIHGQSYGHYAIDIAAGKGATILSPINGMVTQHYVDEWGNPTLVIENDYYQIMMLHGEYTVQVGTAVRLGQSVGTESNLGYTMDMLGRLCTNRDCGYHTHLNVYDKRQGSNVDPLAKIQPTGVGGQ